MTRPKCDFLPRNRSSAIVDERGGGSARDLCVLLSANRAELAGEIRFAFSKSGIKLSMYLQEDKTPKTLLAAFSRKSSFCNSDSIQIFCGCSINILRIFYECILKALSSINDIFKWHNYKCSVNIRNILYKILWNILCIFIRLLRNIL